MADHLVAPVEVRASEDGPMLRIVALVEGRPAENRAEVFRPGALVWPAEGVPVRLRHHEEPVAHAVPVRRDDGGIYLETRATPAIFGRCRSAKHASVEFHSLSETRHRSGVRELVSALLTGVALTDRPEYPAATAEVRSRRRRRWL